MVEPVAHKINAPGINGEDLVVWLDMELEIFLQVLLDVGQQLMKITLVHQKVLVLRVLTKMLDLKAWVETNNKMMNNQ